MDVLGCLVRFNPVLVPAGIPFSVECTVTGRVADARDAARASRMAVEEYLRPLLGPLEAGGLRGWEYIGRRFNLYTRALYARGVDVGVVRAVETGGALVSVTAALAGHAAKLLPGLEAVVEAGRAVAGDVIEGPVYLREAGGGWPEGQKAIDRYVVYDVEGGAAHAVGVRGPWRLVVEASRRVEVEVTPSTGSALVEADFHCVTGWSVRGNRWEGLSLAELLRKAGAPEGGGWVILESPRGYSTVIPLEEALRGEVLLATRLNGRPLPVENGGPVRLVAPRLYGWKNAKWVSRVRVVEEYQDGYWEALAYHERGLASAVERFKVRNPEIAREGVLPGPPRPLRP